VNQNFEVMAGSTNAAKTSDTGRRISIADVAAGTSVKTSAASVKVLPF
jgi:hypothetical protein